MRSLLQLKRFSNRKLEPRRGKKCRAAVEDVEAFRKKRRGETMKKQKRVYGEMELKKFSWTYQKSKIFSCWRSSKKRDVAWAHLWIPCARNVECLRQSLKVREQPERCDGIGYRDLSKMKTAIFYKNKASSIDEAEWDDFWNDDGQTLKFQD